LEEREIYYARVSTPWILPKMALPHSSRLWGFYASECGNKQAGRTKANVAVSFSLGGYNISH
jgi:hypothetical protein